jgi:hypothetical protein
MYFNLNLNKMKNKIFLISTLLIGIVFLNSCLKDDHDYWSEGVAGKMYATVAVPQLQSLGLAPAAGDVLFSFMVNIATDALPTEDITVTLKVDESAITAYNTLKGRSYKLFPNIEILTPTVTIAKGTRTATVNCKVWGAEALDACDNYIAPIGIDNVSGGIPIASNMKTYMLALPISNPYAADYHCVGYRIRPGNPTEPVDAIETLATVDCKTVRKNGFGNYGSYDVTIQVTSDPIIVGGVSCFKCIVDVIDPSTGLSVGGMWPVWTGDLLTPPIPVTQDINYYNPVTKVFVLNAYYKSSANRIMYEVLTRL